MVSPSVILVYKLLGNCGNYSKRIIIPFTVNKKLYSNWMLREEE
jgi:hypothetical protein